MLKWTKGFGCMESEYKGYRISRVSCQSGTKLYFAHAVTYPHYAAPHWHMSSKYYSLKGAKALIDSWVDGGKYFTAVELRIIKAEQHRIDCRYNDYGDTWHAVRSAFDSQFESHKIRV